MNGLFKLTNDWIRLSREVGAIVVPDGINSVLPAGTEVEIVHELGGDFTVRSRMGAMYRIDGADGDAIGRTARQAVRAVGQPGVDALEGDALEEAMMAALRTCFDPEIPINLVDLGLIYGTSIEQLDEGGSRIEVAMTLTAPGCGMGQVIVDDVTRKLRALPGVADVKVDLVFDPPWDPSRMSDAARLQAGLM